MIQSGNARGQDSAIARCSWESRACFRREKTAREAQSTAESYAEHHDAAAVSAVRQQGLRAELSSLLSSLHLDCWLEGYHQGHGRGGGGTKLVLYQQKYPGLL